MCGRYTLTDVEDLLEEAEVVSLEAPEPRYNIAPTQLAPVIRTATQPGEVTDAQRELSMMRWGLIPSWAKEAAIGNRMINARSETAAEKPSFRSAFKRRRCLVPADGFIEWQKQADGKQPFHIHLPQGQGFAMAGLWELWRRGPEPIHSFTILTTSANETVAPVHDRMPVILPREHWDPWLDPELEERELLQSLMVPWAGQDLELTAVSRRINNPRNDDPGCLTPLGEA